MEMKDTSKAFFLELADLLEKHKVEIEASELYRPYEINHGHQVEFCCPGEYIEMETAYVSAGDLRGMVERDNYK
jgi:hypothetical protein